MTEAFFDYPKAAAFGRVVPKSRIYEHAGVGTALRDLFVTQVDQIVWTYKLAPETINLAATKAVSASASTARVIMPGRDVAQGVRWPWPVLQG